ncbi:MAG: putative peptide zinc metalloprotease protein [Chloroflexota bacterium]|jgi:putative peptide zinc metalloprotease protein|nr:putative peptide zinc metalloprotease protein [Chloroflexota bacterium]
MLCRYCRVHSHKDFPFCLKCGQPRKGFSVESATPSMLYPPDSTEGYALTKLCTTIGRSPDNDLVINDKYVSRYHARIWREPDGYRVEDLDAMNGTFVNNQPMASGASTRLKDFDLVGVGPTSLVRIEQPRSADVGGKTMISAPEESMVLMARTPDSQASTIMEEAAPTGLDLRPRRRSGWALKQAPSQPGKLRYVLRNSRNGRYLQLTDRDVFLWNLMDGEHTVRDLLLGYSREYGQLALARIQQLIDQLSGADLIRGVGSEEEQRERGAGKRIYDAIVNFLLRAELAISGVDGVLDRVYRAVGWVFFTRLGLAFIWGFGLLGLVAFFLALQHQAPLDVGGAGILGLLVALLGYSLALMLHEMAHALAVKSYGRKVPRGGFMLMMGMPYAFVDTTDMWFEGKGPRIVVTLAGPVVTLTVACFFSFTALLLPFPVWAAITFQIALGLYINTLFNFNPLIPLDGYYALSDWLDMPHLREEASSYFTKGVWSDLAHRNHIGKRQVGLFLFGMVSVVGMVGFLLLGLLMWNTRLGAFFRERLPQPLDTVVLVTLMLLLFFPIWYGPLMKIRFAIGRRLRPEAKQVEAAPPQAAASA